MGLSPQMLWWTSSSVRCLMAAAGSRTSRIFEIQLSYGGKEKHRVVARIKRYSEPFQWTLGVGAWGSTSLWVCFHLILMFVISFKIQALKEDHEGCFCFNLREIRTFVSMQAQQGYSFAPLGTVHTNKKIKTETPQSSSHIVKKMLRT